MALPDTFSRRNGLRSPQHADVFDYGVPPSSLKWQIVHHFEEFIGKRDEYTDESFWKRVKLFLLKELGVPNLTSVHRRYDGDEVVGWFIASSNVGTILDFIEFGMRRIDYNHRKYSRFSDQNGESIGIKIINARMLEHSFGYQYEINQLIRIDSTFLHKELVKPTLIFLSDENFLVARKEYLLAFDHFKEGSYAASITECGKAFESTLKIIAYLRGWPNAQNLNAKALVDLMYGNKFIDSSVQEGVGALRALLSSSVSVLRNKTSAHGAGTLDLEISSDLAAFQLHQTAAVLQYLIRLHLRK